MNPRTLIVGIAAMAPGVTTAAQDGISKPIPRERARRIHQRAAVIDTHTVLMVPVIVGLVLLLGPYVFGLQLGVVPAWVR